VEQDHRVRGAGFIHAVRACPERSRPTHEHDCCATLSGVCAPQTVWAKHHPHLLPRMIVVRGFARSVPVPSGITPLSVQRPRPGRPSSRGSYHAGGRGRRHGIGAAEPQPQRLPDGLGVQHRVANDAVLRRH
jgi:hypothetical protein